MNSQYLIAMLVTITAIASYVNHRFVRLPKTIGLTVITLALSLCLMSLISIGQHWASPISEFLAGINFSTAVINGMLSYLLFAGAMHINAVELKKYRNIVITLATASVAICTVVIGYTTYYLSLWLGIELDFIHCILFGALIAPTDPIGVIGVMKRTNTPFSVRMKITGEALFNDAVSIFLFILLLEVLDGQAHHLSYSMMGVELVQEGFGGVIVGYVLGIGTSYYLRRVDNVECATLMTLSLVTAGYALCSMIHVSGPIAMVVSGLVVGHQCRRPHFTPKTVKGLYSFWTLIDDMLNSFLFVMIGLEILSINASFLTLSFGFICFIVVIFARLFSVTIPYVFFEPIKHFSWRTISLMTWSGLRGGLSIALALLMPESPNKETILTITYVTVVFSIIFQGLTLPVLIRMLFPSKNPEGAMPEYPAP